MYRMLWDFRGTDRIGRKRGIRFQRDTRCVGRYYLGMAFLVVVVVRSWGMEPGVSRKFKELRIENRELHGLNVGCVDPLYLWTMHLLNTYVTYPAGAPYLIVSIRPVRSLLRNNDKSAAALVLVLKL
ncbi:hypothetical protein F4775DRAFT_203591 [Biscogniauxia sp. FL1348]|nr:hypothetical protein F4775DRAFT_203591 [Biscogniauxia sp. FL1348]